MIKVLKILKRNLNIALEIYFRDFKTKIIIKIAKKLNKIDQQREAIRYQMDKGMANNQISKTLRIPESNIRYQRKRPNNPICKRSSELPKNIDEIYRLTFNKSKREMPSGIITIKIN